MPTYNYRCKTCDTRFDWVQSMSENALTVCPREGGPKACTMPGKGEVTKVFGAVGITFKGSGFYKTDSRTAAKAKDGNGSSGEAGGKKEKKESSSDSKSAGSAAKESGSGSSSKAPASSGSGSSGSGSSGSGSSGSGSSGSGSSGSGSSGSR